MPLITPAVRERLYPYIAAITEEKIGYLAAIGGIEDHAHMLVNVKPSISVSDAMRNVKSYSSGWIHETFRDMLHFAWQGGFASFSVSESNKDEVIDYIRRQEQHHRQMDFKHELILLLKKNNAKFDERYMWQ